MSLDHLLYSQADLKLDSTTLDPHLKETFCKLYILANCFPNLQRMIPEYRWGGNNFVLLLKLNSQVRWERLPI